MKRLSKSIAPVLRRRVFPSPLTPDKQPNRHDSHNQRDHSSNNECVLDAHCVDPWCVDEHDDDGERVANKDNPNESIAENLNISISFSIILLLVV